MQRVFLKYLAFRLDGEYPPQGIDEQVLLNRLNVMSLYDRRLIDMCIFVYNLINNRIRCPWLLGELNFVVPRLASRNSPYFYLGRANTNVLYTTPIHKICSAYNSVCQENDFSFSFNRFLNIVKLAFK